MILARDIPQLDIPDVGRNYIPKFFLVPVRKIQFKRYIQTACLFDNMGGMGGPALGGGGFMGKQPPKWLPVTREYLGTGLWGRGLAMVI